jgi:elongation factor P
MAKLSYSEIKEKKIIIYNGEPCEVVESQVSRKQANKPQNQTKLKSLLSGKTFAATFHTSEMADEADVGTKQIKFIYENNGEFWCSEIDNPANRFQLDENVIGNKAQYLTGNSILEVVTFEDDDEEKIIGINLPIKMAFEVKEAPPNVKGNTASGGDKKVVLETGMIVTTPMFIEVGDKIIVNTGNGEYVERAK